MSGIIDINGVNLSEQQDALEFWATLFRENGFNHLADTLVVNLKYAPMLPPLPPDMVDKIEVHVTEFPADKNIIGEFFKGKHLQA